MIKAKKILGVIISIVLFTVLFANLYLLAARTVFKVSLPKILGFSSVKVMSGSMEPTIDIGDVLIIKEKDSYEKGDIITYNSGDSFITHRIIEANATHLITQGDANNTADPEVKISDVQGEVVLIIPKIGNTLMFLRTTPGLIVLTGIIILLVFILFSSKGQKK